MKNSLSAYRTAKQIFRSFWLHPLTADHPWRAMKRFLVWQAASRMVYPNKIALPLVDDIRMLVRCHMTAASGNYYYGLLEWQEMAFCCHVLREDDVFVDIGANVGIYSILSAGIGGANVIAAEPHPATYLDLVDNILINQLQHKITAFQVAVGNERGTIRLTSDLGAANRRVSAENNCVNCVECEVRTIADILGENTPTMAKIDVEGMELEVLEGAVDVIKNPQLHTVIIETKSHGSRYGHSERSVDSFLRHRGFAGFLYDPASRSMFRPNGSKSANLIYTRDADLIVERTKSASDIEVRNTMHGRRSDNNDPASKSAEENGSASRYSRRI